MTSAREIGDNISEAGSESATWASMEIDSSVSEFNTKMENKIKLLNEKHGGALQYIYHKLKVV